MQIVEKNIDELTPYERNPRKNDNAVQYVANSIKEFGFKVPIVVDKDGVIVAGHTRLKAAKELGMKTVPCIVADDLTEEQVKAFRIADNKTSDQATWDDSLLGEELKGLLDEFDFTDFGFGSFEVSMLTSDFTPEPFDDELIDEYEKNGDDYLAKKRIIITYKPEEEDAVKELLGIEEIDKVVYEFAELRKTDE